MKMMSDHFRAEPGEHALAAEHEPTIGDNKPPLLAGDDLTLHLLDGHKDILDRAVELLEKGAPFATVTSDEDDSASTEFLVKLRAGWKAAEAARVAEKSPYDDAAGQVHAFFKTRVLDPLTALGERVNAAQTKFKIAKADAERKRRQEEATRKAEEERVAREAREKAEREARELAAAASRKRNEEARKLADEAAAKAKQKADEARQAEDKASNERAEAQHAAAAPAAELSRARGGLGGISSLRGRTTFRDLDRERINLEALRPHFTDAALSAAVNSWIKANKGLADAATRQDGKQPLKGVIIYEDLKNAGRA